MQSPFRREMFSSPQQNEEIAPGIFNMPGTPGKGYGKKLLARLAALAIEKECGRLEWAVLDWNEPSIEFYKSLGARLMDEWIVNRITGENLYKLAAMV